MTTRRRGAQIAKVLRDVFGVSELRPGQQAVIDAVLAKQHTLAIMPTGAGKSLCYQVPAMLMPGMTVIVSPLIALMRDQFDKLSGLGLEAVQVNSAIPAADIQRARGKIGRRAVEFVFTTPEQLAGSDLRALLGRDAVDLLVIDEAHCISQWGHDFRPAYLDALSRLHAFGSPTILALTATATPDVVVDIERQLSVGPLCVINTGTHRPNLAYQVRPVSSDADKQRQLVDLVREATGSDDRLRGDGAPCRRATDPVPSGGHSRHVLSRPPTRAGSSRGTRRLHDRGGASHHRHECLWHGHRQAGYPHGHSL